MPIEPDDFDDVDDERDDDDIDDADDGDGDDDDNDPDDGDRRRKRTDRTDDKDRQKDTPSARRALRRERSKVRRLEASINEMSALLRKHGIGSEQRTSTSRRQRSNSNGNGNGNGNGRTEEQPVDVEALTREIEERVSARYREDSTARSIASAAVLALGEAGYTGRARRGVRLLDLADVTVDDDGNVDEDELEDAIEALKEESPELFRPSRRNRSTRRDQRDRDDDEEFDARDSGGSRNRRNRSEGMGRRSSGSGQPKDSLERALLNMVGSSRRSRER